MQCSEVASEATGTKPFYPVSRVGHSLAEVKVPGHRYTLPGAQQEMAGSQNVPSSSQEGGWPGAAGTAMLGSTRQNLVRMEFCT